MKTKYVIFDLDDTLCYEVDYLKSAYREIAVFLEGENSDELYERMIHLYQTKQDVFQGVVENYTQTTKDQLLAWYRNHIPNVNLIEDAKEVLLSFKQKGYKLGVITDGRSITQRNKLKALQIEELFDQIIISEEFGSEKPNVNNFLTFEEDGISRYYYIADNPKKDFVTPNKLGWTSICLIDKGKNIHQQSFELNKKYLPQYKIQQLAELKKLIID